MQELQVERIEEIRLILVDIIDRRKQFVTNKNLYEEFVKLSCSIVYPVVSSEADMVQIWDKVRTHGNEFVNFILMITHELMTRSFDQRYHTYESFCDDIAGNYKWLGSINSNMDQTLRDVILNEQKAKSLYVNNPWFTVLMLTESVLNAAEDA